VIAREWRGPIGKYANQPAFVDTPAQPVFHGASATTAMTHLAISESLSGKNVDWLEKVSDDQYGG
jgi:hypothetical protein